MIVTVGFTRTRMVFTDRRSEGDYIPSMDGYQDGAEQDTVDIEIPDVYTGVDPVRLAEAVFIATNCPYEVDGLDGAVRSALAVHGRFRSLSVGDTVTMGHMLLVCARFGWDQRTAAAQG